MTVIGDLLFFSSGRKPALSDLLRHNLEKGAPEIVNKIPEREFSAKSDDEIIADLVQKYSAEPLALRLNEAKGAAEPASIRFKNHWGETGTLPGLRVTQTIPFDGETQFFDYRPNTYDYNPPRASVHRNSITIGMEVLEESSEDAIKYIEETRATIQEWINRQRPQIEDHNNKLPNVFRDLVQRRRETFSKASDIAGRLNGSPNDI